MTRLLTQKSACAHIPPPLHSPGYTVRLTNQGRDFRENACSWRAMCTTVTSCTCGVRIRLRSRGWNHATTRAVADINYSVPGVGAVSSSAPDCDCDTLFLSQPSSRGAVDTPSRVSFTNDDDKQQQPQQQQQLHKPLPSENGDSSSVGASEAATVNESSPGWVGIGADHNLVSVASGSSGSTPMSTATAHLLSAPHGDTKEHGGGGEGKAYLSQLRSPLFLRW